MNPVQAGLFMTHATVHFDGASSGNPGPMGGGAIVSIGGTEDILSVPLGRGTNNEAEYGGLIAGLGHAVRCGATRVTVRGDSQLAVRQLKGEYKVHAENLRPLYEEALDLLKNFKEVDIEWVPRERNAGADAAARDAVQTQRATR